MAVKRKLEFYSPPSEKEEAQNIQETKNIQEKKSFQNKSKNANQKK